MNHRLVRFDVRLEKGDYVGEFWDEKRRSEFLLLPNIEWPLSVDPMVWPSVFYSKIFRDAKALPYGKIEVDPEMDGGEYWCNLSQMRAYYQRNKPPELCGVFIAIQLFSERPLTGDTVPYVISKNIQAALPLGHALPEEPPAGSEFLGYDIANASWISGLTNCGYPIDENQQLARIWSPHLNSFGLLKNLEDAAKLRDVLDKRLPGHAPFWIYGISRLLE